MKPKKKNDDDQPKTQQKPAESKRIVTVVTAEKSWENTVSAKYDTNDWVTNDRSGKREINLSVYFLQISQRKTKEYCAWFHQDVGKKLICH